MRAELLVRHREGGLIWSARPLWLVWLFCFAYSYSAALSLQILILPTLPSLHAGQGLMNHDAILFHNLAVAMSDRIHALGWQEWSLVPGNGVTANVGILAAVYAVFGADPVWFIPLNAGFHALGALLIVKLGQYFYPGEGCWLAGGFSALIFTVFPSALLWYGQNHKDAFAIAGFLLMLLAFVRALALPSLREMFRDVLIMGAACALVAMMRPHMLVVYAATGGFLLGPIVLWKLLMPGSRGFALVLKVMLLQGILALSAVASLPTLSTTVSGLNASVSSDGSYWVQSRHLPGVIDRVLEDASVIRAHFLAFNREKGSGSGVDLDIGPREAEEALNYLPRALQVGLFAPFPDSWLDYPTLPRLIGAFETFVFYLMVPGIFILACRVPSLPLFFCLVFSALVITVLSYTSPNIGTLHRIRYGPLFILTLAGVAGWISLLAPARRLLLKPLATPPTVTSDTAPASQQLVTEMSEKKWRSGTTHSTFLVVLLSMLGALGLFIRDLLLVNRGGFGADLDSFYLSMMVPMLFVSVLVLPMGDTLTAALSSSSGQRNHQPLVSSAFFITSLLLCLSCLFLLFASEAIYRLLLSGGATAQVLGLIPLTIPILFFSGIVVIGNSILNASERPVQVVLAQLVVPLTAAAVILLAPRDRLVWAAALAMLVGQLLNLGILFTLVRSQINYPVNFSIKQLRDVSQMFPIYIKLVVVSVVLALHIPINYWLVGQLDNGIVSIWAVGSKMVYAVAGLSAALMSSVLLPHFARIFPSFATPDFCKRSYLTLLLINWVLGLFALTAFGFAVPAAMLFFPAIQDEMMLERLVGVMQIGVLQLPMLVSSLYLLKISLVSVPSRKLLMSFCFGLLVNAALGLALMPVWGLLGVSVAWFAASLVTAMSLLICLQSKLFLGWLGTIGVAVGWLSIATLAIAIHFKSLPIFSGALLGLILVLVAQFVLVSDTSFKISKILRNEAKAI